MNGASSAIWPIQPLQEVEGRGSNTTSLALINWYMMLISSRVYYSTSLISLSYNISMMVDMEWLIVILRVSIVPFRMCFLLVQVTAKQFFTPIRLGWTFLILQHSMFIGRLLFVLISIILCLGRLFRHDTAVKMSKLKCWRKQFGFASNWWWGSTQSLSVGRNK